MATKTKVVRFYRPAVLDQNDVAATIESGFWDGFMDQVANVDIPHRVLGGTGGRYYGTVREPAGYNRYLRVGALRDRSDWPDTVELTATADGLTALELDGNVQLFESSYVVPFGASNRVAIMGPIRGMVSTTGIGNWMSFMAGHDTQATRLELTPQVDKAVLKKLNESALSVSRLTVRFPAGAQVQPDDFPDGGDALDAIASAVEARPHEASIEVTLSTGHLRPEAARDQLLRAAKKLIGMGADKLEVNMQVPMGADEQVTEVHNLLKDQISFNVPFEVNDDEALTELSVLAAIHEAIGSFNQQIA